MSHIVPVQPKVLSHCLKILVTIMVEKAKELRLFYQRHYDETGTHVQEKLPKMK